MGLLTLDEFQAELESAIGGQITDATRQARWINQAYAQIVGAVDFEETKDLDDTQATTIAQATVSVPTGAREVIGVSDADDSVPLEFLAIEEYFSLDRSSTTTPERWSRLGPDLYLYPTPDTVINLEILFRMEVAELTTGVATILPDTWDLPILYMAISIAMGLIGEEQRSAFWFSQATALIQTRVTAEELSMISPMKGLTYQKPMQTILANQPAQQGGG